MDVNDRPNIQTADMKPNDANASTHSMFVVRVEERCNPRLVGREGLACELAPQPLAAARTLVCLLLRRGHPEEIRGDTYEVAVAGGRQTITLQELR